MKTFTTFLSEAETPQQTMAGRSLEFSLKTMIKKKAELLPLPIVDQLVEKAAQALKTEINFDARAPHVSIEKVSNVRTTPDGAKMTITFKIAGTWLGMIDVELKTKVVLASAGVVKWID